MGALVALAGCKPESMQEGEAYIPIGVSAGVELSTKALQPGPIRGTHFPTNTEDVFRVSVYASPDAPPATYDSVYDGMENMQVDLTAEDEFELVGGPKYYPVNGDALYFYAYSPGREEGVAGYMRGTEFMTPRVVFELDGTQDILWDTVSRVRKAATLEAQQHPSFLFAHKLMLIEFTARAAQGFDADSLRVSEVRVNRVNTVAELDLVTGEMNYWAQGDIGSIADSTGSTGGWEIQPSTVETENLATFAPLMFEPQDSFFIDVTLSDGTVYADKEVVLSETASEGTSFKVNLTVNRSEITVSATITEWDPQGNANVTLD